MSDKPASTDRLFTITSCLVVLVAIVGGFWLLGSPNKQRLLSLDRERIQDLSTIARSLSNEFNADQSEDADPLPEELPDSISDQDYAQDPVTNEPYEYRRVSDDTYELCATFAVASEPRPEGRSYDYYESEWEHPEGRHCFKLDHNGLEPN